MNNINNNSESELNKTNCIHCGAKIEPVCDVCRAKDSSELIKDYQKDGGNLPLPSVKFKPTRWEGDIMFCGDRIISSIMPYNRFEPTKGFGGNFLNIDIPIMLSKELAKEWVESRWKEFCEAVTE